MKRVWFGRSPRDGERPGNCHGPRDGANPRSGKSLPDGQRCEIGQSREIGRSLFGRGDAIRTCSVRGLGLSALVSLALHAVLIAAVWFTPAYRPPTTPQPLSAPLDTRSTQQSAVEVELVSSSPSQSMESRGRASSRRLTPIAKSVVKTVVRSAKALRPKLDLTPSFKPNFAHEKTANGDIATNRRESVNDGSQSASQRLRGSDQDGSDFIDDPRAEWGSGGADFGRVADFVRLERLYRAVDSRLIYPSILAYHSISGTVNARLVITKRGCDWQHTTISASELHLRVYILDVLQHTCRQSLAEFARADRPSNVDFSFSFAQTEHNSAALIQAQNKIVGNVMLFYRNSQASVAEWKLGPIRGLFPIPAVAVDFVWLKINWDKFVGAAPDPMADYKEKTGPKPAS